MLKTLRPWERAILWGSVLLLIGGCLVACLVALWFYYPVLIEKANQNRTPVPGATGSKAWDNIQAAGKIRVGVSPDFAPLSFYNGAVQFDGFEPALMLEIGKKLGVTVEFSDFAAEGLPAAVNVTELDAALGALNATPENQALADFSLPYYSNEDAVLARRGTNMSNLIAMAQMAPYRVGVKAGSVYEAVIMDQLVEPGRLPEANLVHYAELDQAIDELIGGQIDFIYLGMESARRYMLGGGLELKGASLTNPAYAIAYPNGASELGERLDQALKELEREGKLDELAQLYLALDPAEELAELPRTATDGSGAPLPAPPACLDVSEFQSHLNLPSGPQDVPVQLAPGQVFEKKWQVRNSGTCPWTGSYRLVFAFGDSAQARMGGQPAQLPAVVNSTQSLDVSASLVAPADPGIYRGFWNLVNAKNQAFGERLPVAIEVNPNLSATVPATQPAGSTALPPPAITLSTDFYFTASPLKILPGETVTFVWSVSQPKEVYFYALGQDYLTHPVEATGTRQERPSKTTTYELRAILQDNRMVYQQQRIEVAVSGEGAPAIYEFSISPPRQIVIGQCVTVTWWVDVKASAIRLRRDNVELWTTEWISSNYTDCPQSIGVHTYTLEAIGPGGMSTRNAPLSVNEKPKPPPPTAVPTQTPTLTPLPFPATATAPAPTATSAPPAVIDFFLAEPVEVKVGECALLRWRTSGGSVVVTLWRSGKAILTGAPGEATAQDCYQRDGPVTYRLTAENASGDVEQRDLVVTVKP